MYIAHVWGTCLPAFNYLLQADVNVSLQVSSRKPSQRKPHFSDDVPIWAQEQSSQKSGHVSNPS